MSEVTTVTNLSSAEPTKYQYDLCGYQTTKNSSLKRHKMMVHEGKKSPCDHYENQASRKGDLKQHIESVHEGMKYPCNICQYQATTESSLR